MRNVLFAAVFATLALVSCSSPDIMTCEERCGFRWTEGSDPYNGCVTNVCGLKTPTPPPSPDGGGGGGAGGGSAGAGGD